MNLLRKQTFREYAHRFQIEEELLDEKSNGFHARSLRNSLRARAFGASALESAVATLLLSVLLSASSRCGKTALG